MHLSSCGYAISQRRPKQKAIKRKIKSIVPVAASSGQRLARDAGTERPGSSYQNTLRYPSNAQPLKVNFATKSMYGGIKKRGIILPPRADMTRITIVANAFNWVRVEQMVASMTPNAAALVAVAIVIKDNPASR